MDRKVLRINKIFFYRELVVYHGKKAGEVNLRIDRHKLLESVSC